MSTPTSPGQLASVAVPVWRSARTIKIASVVIVLTLWEMFGRDLGLFFSHPSEIGRAAVDLIFNDDRLLSAFRTTLWGLVVGFSIAASLGIVLGFAMSRFRTLDIMLNPYVSALYATPRITLIPFLVLWVGVGFQLRVTIVVLSVIFPVIIIIRAGASQVDRNLIDLARSLNASGWKVFQTVVLPGTVPYVFVALRIALQRAMIGILVAEMTASLAGTGRLIRDFGRSFQIDRLLVPVIIIGFFSIFMSLSLRQMQGWVAPWSR